MNRRVFIITTGAFLCAGAVNAVGEALYGQSPISPSGFHFTNDTEEPPETNEAPVSGLWTLPARGPVGTAYGVPGSMWTSGHHTGIDFTVPEGTEITAVSNGVVITAGQGGAYGNQVVIHHHGVYTQYAHLSSISVKEGQTVVSGQEIGRSGSTGNVTGPHLHFEVRTGPKYGSDIDPLKYLGERGVRL